jgi:hypothetical protein
MNTAPAAPSATAPKTCCRCHGPARFNSAVLQVSEPDRKFKPEQGQTRPAVLRGHWCTPCMTWAAKAYLVFDLLRDDGRSI